ncbi:MAG TPA: YceI family protein [Vicinamibacteria bacterium]|jgi:polyisoprenoid-binding protein YceI|nr:YceI family protein [Vicinamibacteria bacterium]
MKRPSTLFALAGFLWVGPGPNNPVSLKPSAVCVELQTDAGSVEFVATGWPSALKIHGKGTGPAGTLTVTDHDVTGSVAVDLASLQTGISLRDRHLKEEYLHVDRYPQARLTLSHLDISRLPEGATFGAVAIPFEGTLLLHGVEKPVSGQAKVSRNDSRVAVSAQFSISLGDFGVGVPKYMGITVAEKVDVKAAFSAAVGLTRDVARR